MEWVSEWHDGRSMIVCVVCVSEVRVEASEVVEW